jgi:hypothetical protein
VVVPFLSGLEVNIPAVKLNWREIPLWARIVIVLGFSNFGLFWAVAVALGGDADEARSHDGKFYLSNHGRHVVVSEAVFTYSRIHRNSAFCGFAAASLTAGIYYRRKVLGTQARPVSSDTKRDLTL